VKVLDFGLAKILETETPTVDPSNSPTLVGHTGGNMIVGTAAYMSPEQARGRSVDKRTDIWAFGCVAYEILTGRQAFGGETVTDIVASIVKGEPDWSQLPANAPSTLRLLLRQCLNKQAKLRLHDIADARITIEYARSEPALPAVVAPTPSAKKFDRLWIVAFVFVAVLLIGAFTDWLEKQPAGVVGEPMHFQMSVRPAEQLTPGNSSVRPHRTAMAISPNGKMLVFTGDTNGSPFQLYKRELTQGEAVPFPGTEGAIAPFFSPDGQWIGFFTRDQLKKIPISGGPAVVICTVQSTQGSFGASWADDGTIFFSDRGTGISKVPSGGGMPVAVTNPDTGKGEAHLLPHALPGSKALVFTSVTAGRWENARVMVHTLEGGENRELFQGGEDVRYTPTGHLLFMKMGTLMAVPFDLQQLRVSGEPVALLENVMQAVNTPNTASETGAGQFALSNTGTLVYVTGGVHPLPESSVLWLHRGAGSEPLTWVPPRSYRSPRLSPDQSKVLLTVSTPGSRTMDVWVYEVLRGTPTRLTFGGFNWPSVWSPDGKRVAFSSAASGVNNLYLANSDGSGQIERLTTSEHTQSVSSWSSANNSIAYWEGGRGMEQIWVVPMDGERKPKLFLESRFSLYYPEFSPDGHWLAYVSTESGGFDVYVQPYPGPGEKYRISVGGATQPVWTKNGREILFRGNSQEFFSATITSFNPFRAETPRLIYKQQGNGFSSTTPVRAWDATPDGERLLVTQDKESNDKPVNQLAIVLNWDQELQRRVPAK